MVISIYLIIGFLFFELVWKGKFIRFIISLALEKASKNGQSKIFAFLTSTTAIILSIIAWPVAIIFAFIKD